MRPWLFALLLASCMGGQPGDGVPPSPLDSGGTADTGPSAPTHDPRFDALREAMAVDLAANLGSAMQVAVWMEGEVHFVGALGTADPDARVPVGERTVFAIGSDTKKLAALHALQRVQSGALSLDTTVGNALPTLEMALAPDFLNATLENLLQHEGGIVDSSPWTTNTTDSALQAFTLGDFADLFYPLAPPGTFWNYANPNFSIAGAMDEATGDGTPWADALVSDLTGPLGMTRTFGRRGDCDDDHTDGVGYQSPESSTPATVRFEDTLESAWVRPAGLVWSTASDQARLAGFLVEGDETVLESDLMDRLTSAAVPIYPDLPGSYGMGLFVSDHFNLPDGTHATPVWWHGGNTSTHTSAFWVLPEQGFAISVLSNGYGGRFDTTLLAAFSTLVDLPEATPTEPLPFDPSALDGLAGVYTDPFNVGDLTIAREGEAGLRIEAPVLDALGLAYSRDLSPVTTQIWLWEANGATYQLDFLAGPDGRRWVRNRYFAAVDSRGDAATRSGSVPLHPSLPVVHPGPSPLDAVLRFRAP